MAICGTARNAALGLRESLAAIDEIRSAAESSCVVIVTNDNDDETERLLAEWSKDKPASLVIVCDGIARALPDRIDRLAAVRNMYLQALCEQAVNYDVLAVLDLDGPNAQLSAAAVANTLVSAPRDWAAMFANQPIAYYDLYALRHSNWVDADVWSEVQKACDWMRVPYVRWANRATRGRIYSALYRRSVRKYVYERQYCIEPQHPPIEVESAFGGLGLYRFDAALVARYESRLPSGEVICEHVPFNRSISSRGGRLYISPSMLNIAPHENLGPGSGAPFPRYLGQKMRGRSSR